MVLMGRIDYGVRDRGQFRDQGKGPETSAARCWPKATQHIAQPSPQPVPTPRVANSGLVVSRRPWLPACAHPTSLSLHPGPCQLAPLVRVPQWASPCLHSGFLLRPPLLPLYSLLMRGKRGEAEREIIYTHEHVEISLGSGPRATCAWLGIVGNSSLITIRAGAGLTG